jgi:hypothetical protein
LAVNGSHQASRSLGAMRSLAALEVWAVIMVPENGWRKGT